MIVELLASEGNHQCAVCMVNNHCELQNLAYEVGLHLRARALPLSRQDTSTRRTKSFIIDHNRCVLCTRCVRVCHEVEGAHVWDIAGPRHRLRDHLRPEPAMGHIGQLHVVRQMRAGLSRRAPWSKKGEAVAEMEKQTDFLKYIVTARPQTRMDQRGHEKNEELTPMKPRVATVWLGGCSGCHMSFLDMDERLIELADKMDLVYSPIADVKEFPRDVDVTLVEGAVANVEHEELAHIIRRNSRIVVSFGDCAVTGNVTAMRNRSDTEEVLHRSYVELADLTPQIPRDYPTIAELMPQARPLHEFITVDAFIHGCPPTADQIWFAVSELLEGKNPALLARLSCGTGLKGTRRPWHARTITISPGDPHRGAREDHDPARRPGERRGCPIPRQRVPRLREVLRGTA